MSLNTNQKTSFRIKKKKTYPVGDTVVPAEQEFKDEKKGKVKYVLTKDLKKMWNIKQTMVSVIKQFEPEKQSEKSWKCD